MVPYVNIYIYFYVIHHRVRFGILETSQFQNTILFIYVLSCTWCENGPEPCTREEGWGRGAAHLAPIPSLLPFFPQARRPRSKLFHFGILETSQFQNTILFIYVLPCTWCENRNLDPPVICQRVWPHAGPGRNDPCTRSGTQMITEATLGIGIRGN